jgi:hypothetical protein
LPTHALPICCCMRRRSSRTTMSSASDRVDRARAVQIDAAYGPLLPTMPDPRSSCHRWPNALPDCRPERRVLCLLKPSRDMSLDEDDLAAALQCCRELILEATTPSSPGWPAAHPILPSEQTFRSLKQVQLNGMGVEVRMESCCRPTRSDGWGLASRRRTPSRVDCGAGCQLRGTRSNGRAIRRRRREHLLPSRATSSVWSMWFGEFRAPLGPARRRQP